MNTPRLNGQSRASGLPVPPGILCTIRHLTTSTRVLYALFNELYYRLKERIHRTGRSDYSCKLLRSFFYHVYPHFVF